MSVAVSKGFKRPQHQMLTNECRDCEDTKESEATVSRHYRRLLFRVDVSLSCGVGRSKRRRIEKPHRRLMFFLVVVIPVLL